MAIKRFTIEEMQAQLNSAKDKQSNIFSGLAGKPTKTTPAQQLGSKTAQSFVFKFDGVELPIDFSDERDIEAQEKSEALRWRNWRRLAVFGINGNYLHRMRSFIGESLDSANGTSVVASVIPGGDILALELMNKHGQFTADHKNRVAVLLFRFESNDHYERTIQNYTSGHKGALSAITNNYRCPDLVGWATVSPNYVWK